MEAVHQLTEKQKLDLKTALVATLIQHADDKGMVLGCSLDEFADKVVSSFEKRIHERISFKRLEIFLN